MSDEPKTRTSYVSPGVNWLTGTLALACPSARAISDPITTGVSCVTLRWGVEAPYVDESQTVSLA
eukprot:scaffold40574_cov27-Tisochrysis_lutea.AAC.6